MKPTATYPPPLPRYDLVGGGVSVLLQRTNDPDSGVPVPMRWIMMDDLENLFYENNERLQIIYEDELSIGNLLFEEKGKLNPQPDDDAPIDTVECNGERIA